jgi:hypothetical protein
MTATTSGGASSASGTDWLPLRGRPCVIWPDFDEPGRRYGDEVAVKLRALGCEVEVIDVAALNLPEHGDVVDWFAANPGATRDDVLKLPRLSTDKPSDSNQSVERPPVPLPSPLPDVPAFDPSLLPQSLRPWCEALAEGLQVPLDFVAVPAMVAVGGAIGRRVGIAMKRHQRWVELPLLWGCVVGRPSSGKSPALAPAQRMLQRLERDERQAYETALHEYEMRSVIADASRANARKEIQGALKRGNAGAAEAAAAAMMDEDQEPIEPRIVVNDATVEKLGELLNQNPGGLVQVRDELAGWLANMDREGREADRGFWLESWNGHGAFTVDRIGRGTVRIDACAMSVLGGVQPGKLAEYVRGAVRGGFSDDGLIQRFGLAVYPDLPASWRYVDASIGADAERSAWKVFQRVRGLDSAYIGAERLDGIDVPFLRFTDEAQELLIEWMTDLLTRLRRGEEAPWIESHLAKYPSLAGRLALVLHLADNEPAPVRRGFGSVARRASQPWRR